MKVVVAGSEGFIGSSLCDLLDNSHDIIRLTRRSNKLGSRYIKVDLTSKRKLIEIFKITKPDAIINCAGIVNSLGDMSLNLAFTKNILEAITEANIGPKRIIVLGSAAEYGVVKEQDLPVREDMPLKPISDYGKSKRDEEVFALEYAKEHQLSLVVARIFNPLGGKMQSKFLISRILSQVEEIQNGQETTIEVNRLDAKRDYVDVRDLASAIRCLLEGIPKHMVYNVGSGVATSNGDLVKLVLDQVGNSTEFSVTETSPTPEPIMAIQANIERLREDFGWKPEIPLHETVRGVIHNGSDK